MIIVLTLICVLLAYQIMIKTPYHKSKKEIEQESKILDSYFKLERGQEEFINQKNKELKNK